MQTIARSAWGEITPKSSTYLAIRIRGRGKGRPIAQAAGLTGNQFVGSQPYATLIAANDEFEKRGGSVSGDRGTRDKEPISHNKYAESALIYQVLDNNPTPKVQQRPKADETKDIACQLPPIASLLSWTPNHSPTQQQRWLALAYHFCRVSSLPSFHCSRTGSGRRAWCRPSTSRAPPRP